jgi:hypothetical protein
MFLLTPLGLFNFFLKKKSQLGCQWLTSVTLAPWEAEIGRIMVAGQPRQTFMRLPISTERKRLSMVKHFCNPNNGRQCE